MGALFKKKQWRYVRNRHEVIVTWSRLLLINMSTLRCCMFPGQQCCRKLCQIARWTCWRTAVIPWRWSGPERLRTSSWTSCLHRKSAAKAQRNIPEEKLWAHQSRWTQTEATEILIPNDNEDTDANLNFDKLQAQASTKIPVYIWPLTFRVLFRFDLCYVCKVNNWFI